MRSLTPEPAEAAQLPRVVDRHQFGPVALVPGLQPQLHEGVPGFRLTAERRHEASATVAVHPAAEDVPLVRFRHGPHAPQWSDVGWFLAVTATAHEA